MSASDRCGYPSIFETALEVFCVWLPNATASPGLSPSTVRPNTCCELGEMLICILGSSLASFETSSSTRPSNCFELRSAGKLTVNTCAERPMLTSPSMAAAIPFTFRIAESVIYTRSAPGV